MTVRGFSVPHAASFEIPTKETSVVGIPKPPSRGPAHAVYRLHRKIPKSTRRIKTSTSRLGWMWAPYWNLERSTALSIAIQSDP